MTRRRAGDPAARDGLGQEERPAQVGVDESIEALRRHVQHVLALLDGDAGIVDQHLQPAEGVEDPLHQLAVPLHFRNITEDERAAHAPGGDPRQRLRGGGILDKIVDDHVVAVVGEGPGDGTADAAAAAGDQRSRPRDLLAAGAADHARSCRAMIIRWI